MGDNSPNLDAKPVGESAPEDAKPQHAAPDETPATKEDTSEELSKQLKEAKLDGDDLNLTSKQRETLEQLKLLQKDHLKLEEEYEAELLALQAKYIQKYNPLYEERAAVLKRRPSPDIDQDQSQNTGTPCLPNFWLTTMQNNGTIVDMICECDEPILGYLTNITMKWLDIDQQLSFKVIFEFIENPHFENAVLSKTFILEKGSDGEDALGDKILTGTEGTKIDWKPEKNITMKKSSRTQRNKRTKEKRIIEETVPNETFFNFFETRQIPNENMKATQFKDLKDIVEAEVDVGCCIRDEVIPLAVRYYLNEIEDSDDEDAEESDSDSTSSDLS